MSSRLVLKEVWTRLRERPGFWLKIAAAVYAALFIAQIIPCSPSLR